MPEVLAMPADEYRGWLGHLSRHGGDFRTQFLLATLCAIQTSTKERPRTAADFLPWLKEKEEPEPLDAHETETLDEYLKRVG